MQLDLSASPKSTQVCDQRDKKEQKKKHEKLQHINVHVNSRLIHGKCLIDQLPFYQGGQSGNLGSNDIKVVSGVCAGSRV